MLKQYCIYLAVIICLFLLLACACSKDNTDNISITFLAMGGIPVELISSGVSENTLSTFALNAEKLIENWETQLSLYRSDSLINRICNSPGSPVHLPEEAWKTMKRAKEFWELSEGTFDITVGPLVLLWKHAEKTNEIPKPIMIKNIRNLIGFQHLHFNEHTHSVTYIPIYYLFPSQYISESLNYLRNFVQYQNYRFSIDTGGIAKGLFAQWLTEIFVQTVKGGSESLKKFIANVGGDMYCYCSQNDRPCQIGIQSPFNKGIWGKVEVSNCSIVSSGTYERFFSIKGEKYCHIINPLSGYPISSSLVSVTIVDSDGGAADALATIFFLLGEKRGQSFILKRPSSSVIVIRNDGSWYASKNIQNRLKIF